MAKHIKGTPNKQQLGTLPFASDHKNSGKNKTGGPTRENNPW